MTGGRPCPTPGCTAPWWQSCTPPGQHSWSSPQASACTPRQEPGDTPHVALVHHYKPTRWQVYNNDWSIYLLEDLVADLAAGGRVLAVGDKAGLSPGHIGALVPGRLATLLSRHLNEWNQLILVSYHKKARLYVSPCHRQRLHAIALYLWKTNA